MKKFLSLMLALVLAAGLGVSALAADLPEGWTPADGARGSLPEGWTPADGAREPELVSAPIPEKYAATVTVNGVEVKTANLPGAPAGYVPMRAVTEADGGTVSWYAEEKQAFFFFDNNRITVDLTTCAVEVEFEAREDVKAYYDGRGFTYLPVSLLQEFATVTVDDHPEMDSERYDIKTSNSDPMVQLTKEIIETVEMGARTNTSLKDLVEYYEFGEENYVSIVAYFPMMINADTIIIAEVAEGKMDAAKADFQNKLDITVRNFENYLPDPHEMALNGKIVESPDGSHLMLIISADNDKAIEMFNAAYGA